MYFNNKFNFNKSSTMDFTKEFQNIQLAQVIKVGKVILSGDDSEARIRDRRFNSDDHAIRCRIVGGRYDNKLTDLELPNCFPLLPRHLNFVPKEKEYVLLFVFNEDKKFGDRHYIGPISSSPTRLDKELGDTTALSTMSVSNTSPPPELDKIVSAVGVYENPQNVVIEGRNNTDLIQRPNEILLRSGKFVINDPLKFNAINPAYVQLKFNVVVNNEEEKTSDVFSVNNIVANKINLLTYGAQNAAGETYNLTTVNDKTKVAEYLTNDEIANIIDTAHPVVFGDTLVEYLKLLKGAFLNHAHNRLGAGVPTDRKDKGESLKIFVDEAEKLERKMLSTNIRVN